LLQGKAPKEIHAILTETLACFLPCRAKDLSAPSVLAVLNKTFKRQVCNGRLLIFTEAMGVGRVAQLV